MFLPYKCMKTIVINLIGGPGSGKSVCAAELFAFIKKAGRSCEVAWEFAKDKVFEESLRVLDDQVYVFGKMYHKIKRLEGKVEVIITDSPLPISLYYNQEESEFFDKFVVEQYKKFDNLMYFIERNDWSYEQNGRTQSFEEAKEIDKRLRDLMRKYDIPFRSVPQGSAVTKILGDLSKIIE